MRITKMHKKIIQTSINRKVSLVANKRQNADQDYKDKLANEIIELTNYLVNSENYVFVTHKSTLSYNNEPRRGVKILSLDGKLLTYVNVSEQEYKNLKAA